MPLTTRHFGLTVPPPSLGRARAKRCFVGAAVAAVALLGNVVPALAATTPTLAVVVLGNGAVVSKPAAIACPTRCTATFSVGTSVLLTPQPKGASSFLGWGGSCTGTGTCSIKVSALTAVAAEFTTGPKSKAQPPSTKSIAVPGSYSGSSRGNYGTITFFVAPGGTGLLNVSVPNLGIACAPAGSFPSSYNLGILRTAIAPNGSFVATGTEQGVFVGAPAVFSYSFSGRFQRATAAGPATATGTFEGGVVFAASGATERCRSNEQTWTATHDPQPAPQKSVPVPGSYTGYLAGELRDADVLCRTGRRQPAERLGPERRHRLYAGRLVPLERPFEHPRHGDRPRWLVHGYGH